MPHWPLASTGLRLFQEARRLLPDGGSTGSDVLPVGSRNADTGLAQECSIPSLPARPGSPVLGPADPILEEAVLLPSLAAGTPARLRCSGFPLPVGQRRAATILRYCLTV